MMNSLRDSYRPGCCSRVQHFAVVPAVLCVSWLFAVSELWAQGKPLTLWLMPAEPAIDNPGASATGCEKWDLARFNDRYGEGHRVNVLNTSLPGLRDQLPAFNPEFATTNWSMIAGQCKTLEALERFASSRGTQVNVRFVAWGQAFRELDSWALDRIRPVPAPDVVQSGSTWIAYFSGLSLNATLPEDLANNSNWYLVDSRPVAIKYLTDQRLLFYWKRLPSESLTHPTLRIDDSTWLSAVDSLRRHARRTGPAGTRPMVFPVGLTVNLIYDYLPFLWASGNPFLTPSWLGWFTKADLSSESALAPLLELTQATSGGDASGQRILAFPEVPHEEATQSFMRGDYRAIIEPVAFVKRWHDAFVAEQTRSEDDATLAARSFWDYAAVAVLPSPFKGGSGLMVARDTSDRVLAFDLARFIATDTGFSGQLADHGQLTALNLEAGLDSLVASLFGSLEVTGQGDGVRAFIETVNRAHTTGREAPTFEAWPTVESTVVLEHFQRLWRRIGEGSGESVQTAAAELELVINRRLHPPTRLFEDLQRWWGFLAPVLLILALSNWAFWRRSSLSTKDALRKRSLTSSVVLAVDWVVHRSFNPHKKLGEEEARKRVTVLTLVNAWLRGIHRRNWRREKVRPVIWRSILIAVDAVGETGLLALWGDPNKADAESFLRAYKSRVPTWNKKTLLRDTPPTSDESNPFHFDVSIAETISDKAEVKEPLLVEQALVCLIQNALQQSFQGETTGCYSSVTVQYLAKPPRVRVINDGLMDSDLCRLINDSTTIKKFSETLETLETSNARKIPGIGLTQAFCIANQHLHGLGVELIDSYRTAVTLYI
jgi:hypothetical protein